MIYQDFVHPHLCVNDLTVTYKNGHTAIYDANFSISGGSICAVVGMNGSGKSTLFKSIMGFIKPSVGRILITKKPVAVALKKNLVAYVPQTEGVDWNFPVLVEDVVMMGRYGKMNFLRIPTREDRQWVDQALECVGLGEFRRKQIGELSGGQKKRVFLARALVQQSTMLLLDEPFSGVDIKTENAIIQLLRALRNEGCLILIATHHLSSVPEFCDQAILINRTMIASGPIATTFTQKNIEKAFGRVLRNPHPTLVN